MKNKPRNGDKTRKKHNIAKIYINYITMLFSSIDYHT